MNTPEFGQSNASEALRQDLIKGIRQNGPITFANFMQRSLYEKHGFFSNRAAEFSGTREGNFLNETTFPEQSTLLGEAVAAQIRAVWDKMERPDRFDFVEVGGGTGSFAKTVIQTVKKAWPDFYEHLSYTIVDISPSLISTQKHKLAGEKVNLVLGSAINFPLRDVIGVIFSNELVDNIPFHRVKFENGRLREIFVGERDGKLVDIYGEPSTPALEEYLREEKVSLKERQGTHVSLLANEWMSQASKALKRGFVLTIDYGDYAQILRDTSNIFETVSLGIINESHDGQKVIYSQPGKYDISTPVDFSALAIAGQKVGLRYIDIVSLGDFLQELGITELATFRAMSIKDPTERMKYIDEIKRILFRYSSPWQVLLQQKV